VIAEYVEMTRRGVADFVERMKFEFVKQRSSEL